MLIPVTDIARGRVNSLALSTMSNNSEKSMEGISKRRALGVHVFAGGFAGGVQRVFDVVGQLECHGFGLSTAREVWGVDPVIDCPAPDWPRISADMVYANCRCTAWSCTTAGYGASGHGIHAKQCSDTHQLFEYALGHYPVIILESVNQAYSTGAPLFAEYTKKAEKLGYRVAHVFVNGATFGNCQQRKRYFYVLYPRDKQFNVSMPEVSPYYSVLYDAIGHLRNEVTEPWDRRSIEYHKNSYAQLNEWDMAVIPKLPTGWGLNAFAQYSYDELPKKYKHKWDERDSNMPFSMHCITRCPWLRPCPTLQSSSTRLVHPWHHRTLTVGELAAVMGWGDKIPVGHDPCHQLAKGVVPAVGEWIAEQALSCLDDDWGGEEWTTRYDANKGVFDGEDSKNMLEKVIHVSRFVGHQFDVDRYPAHIVEQFHKFNVCSRTGKLLKPWKSVQRKGTLL